MKDDLDAAKRYRHHAEELRVIASGYKDVETRATLLRVAVEYDRMARSRELIDKRDNE